MAKFQPGKSGNPGGRPRKTRSGADKIRQALLGDAPEILAALAAQAKQGDPQAAKLILDRCIPPMRPTDNPVSVPIPVANLADAAKAILLAASTGQVTITEAQGLASVLASTAKAIEIDELVKRIDAREAATHGNA